MSLSVGDRRWAILDNRVVEFLFVDQDENQVRVLLPAAFPEGQAVTLDGHSVKVVAVRAKSTKSVQAIQTYPVDSSNAAIQAKITTHGAPNAVPAISSGAIETYRTQNPLSSTRSETPPPPPPSAAQSVASEDDIQVKILTQLYQLGHGQNEMRSRLEMLERERGLTAPSARASPPAPQPGVTFGEAEDDEVSESELATLRAHVFEGLTSKQPPRAALRAPTPPAPPTPAAPPAPAAPAAVEALPAPAIMRLVEQTAVQTAKAFARPFQHDDLLYTGEPRSTGGAKGMAKKAELEAAFAASPYKKYKVVMAQARAELGIDEEYYDDANAAKKYFKEFVLLQKYTMGKHMFELINAMHAAMKKEDHKRVYGLIAASYQFLEQYSIDSSPGKSDFYLAHFATHQPALSNYPAEKPEEPIGMRLKCEPDLAAAAHAYQRDVDQLRKYREERAKKQ